MKKHSHPPKMNPHPQKGIYVAPLFVIGLGLWGLSFPEPEPETETYINVIFIGSMVMFSLLTIYMWWKDKERYVVWVRAYLILLVDIMALFLLVSSWVLFEERLWLGIVYFLVYAGSIVWIHLDPRRVAYFMYGTKSGTYTWMFLLLLFLTVLPHHNVVKGLEGSNLDYRIALGFTPLAICGLLVTHCLWVYTKYPDWTVDKWRAYKKQKSRQKRGK